MVDLPYKQEARSTVTKPSTMGQNREKYRINSRLIIHCPTSEEVSKVSEAGEHASKASCAEQANKQTDKREANTSRFFVDLAHCAVLTAAKKMLIRCVLHRGSVYPSVRYICVVSELSSA